MEITSITWHVLAMLMPWHCDAIAMILPCHCHRGDNSMAITHCNNMIKTHGNNTGGNMHANIMATAWQIAWQHHANIMAITWK
jgi:hypothetical protein